MLLELSGKGLYCRPGNFHVDPWEPVPTAVVTHAHADHARPGSERYVAAAAGEPLLRARLGEEARLDLLAYSEVIELGGVQVSLHPAGHVLGSAQIRLEYQGEVWVVSGDYKRTVDPTCAPFEIVPCDTFITEATFALPIYRWPEPEEVFEEINKWWRENQGEGRATVLFAYALGKAQRVLSGVDASIGPVYVHGAVDRINRAYEEAGVSLPDAAYATDAPDATDWNQTLIVAPTSAQNTPWLKRFGTYSSGFASGWMRVRGQRRRRSVDRGFVLSDHADWPALVRTVEETGAQRVFVTHGYTPPLVRWLRESGLEAYGLQTRFRGEEED